METFKASSRRVPNINERRRIPSWAIRAVVKQIVEKFQPDKIILFGSYAYGKPRPESDVDLLVVMETPLRNSEQETQIARAIDYHFGLDLLVRNSTQIKERLVLGDFFMQEVIKKGKVLYARPDTRMGRQGRRRLSYRHSRSAGKESAES